MSFIDKSKALFNLFRAGGTVANPKAWKTGQMTCTAVGGLLMSLAYIAKVFFGYELPIDQDTANAIGTGLIAVANIVLTIITSKHASLPGLDPAQPMQPANEPDAESMPSPQSVPNSASEAPSRPSVASQVPRITDATRERASAWFRQQEAAQYDQAGA